MGQPGPTIPKNDVQGRSVSEAAPVARALRRLLPVLDSESRATDGDDGHGGDDNASGGGEGDDGGLKHEH